MSLFKWFNKKLNENLNKAGVYNIAGHFIMPDAMARGGVVIDLGAHKGRFYNLMHKDYDAVCYGVEASPALAKQLPAGKGIHTFNYAISSSNGTMELTLSNEPEANSLIPGIAANWGITETVTVPSITFETFLAGQKIPDTIAILKVDIEGSELDVIEEASAATLKRIRQMPVEFHDFLGVGSDYKPRMMQAIKKLETEGFLVLRLSSYNYCEVLCINKSLIPLTAVQNFRLTVIHPLLRDLKAAHTRMGNISR
jgi:FkbM family methyltransferase